MDSVDLRTPGCTMVAHRFLSQDHPRSHLFQYFRYQLMMWVGVGLRVPLDLYTIGHFAFQRPSFFRDL